MEGSTSVVWLAIGLAGQACFFARFLVQWIASERQRRSVVPESFWYLSLAGGLAVLAYAVHRRDAVIAVGQIAGLCVYSRNVLLLRLRRFASRKGRSNVRDSLSG